METKTCHCASGKEAESSMSTLTSDPGGLLSSRDAARSVFWALQAWRQVGPVGPVTFHRCMPRTPSRCNFKASMDPYERWEQNGRTSLSFFLLQDVDFNHSSIQSS